MDCIRNLSVGMHLDGCELIWFKLGIMIDATKLYILTLVYVALTLIQGHRNVRKQNFWASYLTKISVDLDGIWCTSWDLLVSWTS